MKNLHNIYLQATSRRSILHVGKMKCPFNETQRLLIMNTMDDEAVNTVMLRLPSTLSAYSGGKSQLLLQADTVEQLLHELENQHHQVWEHLCR